MIKKIMKDYDVIVAGGGSGGVAAAVGAAQAGAKVLLIERNPFFGGNATQSSLPSYCGFFTDGNPAIKVVGGVGETVINKLSRIGACEGPRRLSKWGIVVIVIDPEATKFVLDEVLEEVHVDVLLHTNIINAGTQNGEVNRLTCQDDEGVFNVTAKVFVDATGEGNLTFLADGEYQYGSKKGAVQNGTLALRFGGIKDNSLIDQATVEKAIARGIADGLKPLSRKTCAPMPVPNTNDVIANLADENVDGLNAASLTKAEISARKQARAYLEIFRRYIPGCENAFLVQTGPKIGIRETRHIAGETVLSGEDALKARKRDDAIARGAWPVEIHPGAGEPPIWQGIKDNGYFDIPLGALKVKNMKNLWAAGRIISCDDVAFSSIRVMGTSFATGHAAGVAAALQAQKSISLKVEDVRNELLRQGAII